MNPESQRKFSAAIELYRAEQFAAAIHMLEEITAESPDQWDALLYLAMCRFYAGDLKNARAALNYIVRNCPFNQMRKRAENSARWVPLILIREMPAAATATRAGARKKVAQFRKMPAAELKKRRTMSFKEKCMQTLTEELLNLSRKERQNKNAGLHVKPAFKQTESLPGSVLYQDPNSRSFT